MFRLCSQDKPALGSRINHAYVSLMYPHQVSDPRAISLADFESMAQKAYDALPEIFRNRPANPPYQGRRTCLTLSFAERKTRA